MFTHLKQVFDRIPADLLGMVVTDVGLTDEFKPYAYAYQYSPEPART
jgi:translation initiation factor 2B subunit (eIF-2B alpha/beta/delta family)